MQKGFNLDCFLSMGSGALYQQCVICIWTGNLVGLAIFTLTAYQFATETEKMVERRNMVVETFSKLLSCL